MRSYEEQISWPLEKGLVVMVSEQRCSVDQIDWTLNRDVVPVEGDEIFKGTRLYDGPSYSLASGKTYSGRCTCYCSRYNGRRWVSMRCA